MANEMTKTKPNLLAKEIRPFGDVGMQVAGIKLLNNPDPVLQYLAFKDEELWRTMERSEMAIFNAKQHRIATTVSAGSVVEPGDSGSPRAEELKDFTVAFLKRIPNWTTVQAKMLEAIFWGWRPMEVLWDFNFDHKGTTYWGVKTVREHMPELFKFTEDRDLAYVGNGMDQPVIFNKPQDRFRWMVCTANSTAVPYGEALLKNLWLAYYVKSRFTQMWAQGMERSLGVVKAVQQQALEGDQTSMAQIKRELSGVLDLLSANNVLVQKAGWILELVSDVEFSEAWQHPLEYLDKQMTLGITAETLTMSVDKAGGSRALGNTQRESLTDLAKMDAKQEEGWVNDQLIRPALELNFGTIAEEDIPKWKSKVHSKLEVETVEAAFQWGAPIDGNKTMKELGVPINTDPQEGDLILQKTETPSPFGMPTSLPPGGAGGLPGESSQDPNSEQAEEEVPAARVMIRAATESTIRTGTLATSKVEDVVQDGLDEIVQDAKTPAQKFVDALTRSWFAENPDPSKGQEH